MPGGAALADDFHVYAVEWTTNQIQFFLDTDLFATVTPANVPSGGTWVFTAPEFIILNIAVGGNWPGNPDETTVFPQQMLVDYVRVYSYVAGQTNAAATNQIPVTIQPGGQVSWPTTNGTTWTLQSASRSTNVVWNTLLGPTAGDGTTNFFFDPLWPSADAQYQVLQVTAGAGNIVANSGFEAGSGSSVSNWSITGSQPPVRVSTSWHGGLFSMSLAVTNPTATANNSEIDQNVVNQGGVAVVPGQTYNFSFYAEQVSSGVSLVQNYRINWLNSGGGTIGSVGWNSFTGGNGSWAQISTNNLVAPTNAVNALITIYATTGGVLKGYGNVLIDDVSLSYATPGQTNTLAAVVQPGVQVSWPSTSGELYDFQATENLGGNDWSNLVASLAGNGGTNTVSDILGTNQCRFYRIVGHP